MSTITKQESKAVRAIIKSVCGHDDMSTHAVKNGHIVRYRSWKPGECKTIRDLIQSRYPFVTVSMETSHNRHVNASEDHLIILIKE